MNTSPAVRRLLVSGLVQGVGYRHATTVVAARLAVYGWVRNLADGRVEVAVWGEAEAVARLIAWTRQGPPASRVDEVLVEEGPAAWSGAATGFVQRPTATGPEPL